MISSVGSLKTTIRIGGAISGMKGCKPEYSLPLACTHLGFTPCVRGVTARPASLSFGAIVVACGVRKAVVRGRDPTIRFTRISPKYSSDLMPGAWGLGNHQTTCHHMHNNRHRTIPRVCLRSPTVHGPSSFKVWCTQKHRLSDPNFRSTTRDNTFPTIVKFSVFGPSSNWNTHNTVLTLLTRCP